MLGNFHILVDHLYIFFGKNACSGPLPNFYLDCLLFYLLSCTSFLYCLDINPLSDIWVANIFSQHIGSLTTLSMVSFAMQSFFMVLVYFSSYCFPFCVISKIISKAKVTVFPLMLSSRRFTASGITSKSLSHFELVSVYAVRFKCPLSLFCMWLSSFHNIVN